MARNARSRMAVLRAAMPPTPIGPMYEPCMSIAFGSGAGALDPARLEQVDAHASIVLGSKEGHDRFEGGRVGAAEASIDAEAPRHAGRVVTHRPASALPGPDGFPSDRPAQSVGMPPVGAPTLALTSV